MSEAKPFFTNIHEAPTRRIKHDRGTGLSPGAMRSSRRRPPSVAGSGPGRAYSAAA